jgi:hypothetical protein
VIWLTPAMMASVSPVRSAGRRGQIRLDWPVQQGSALIFRVLPLFVTGFMALYYAAGVGAPEVWAALTAVPDDGAVVFRWIAGLVGLLLAGCGVYALFQISRQQWFNSPEDSTGVARLRWSVPLLLTALLAWLVSVQLQELQNVLERVTDFGTFYRASQAVSQGGDPYGATIGEYFYPPTFAWLIQPLTVASMTWASVIWFTAKLMMLAAMLRWAFEMLDGWSLGPRGRALFLIGTLAATARFWVADLQYGNTNLVIGFLLMASVWLDLRRHALLAGTLLAIAATIKVVPGLLFLWLLARRRWGTVVAGGVALVVINLLPFVSGPSAALEIWQRYLDFGVVGKLSGDLGNPDNQSLWGMLSRALPGHPGVVRTIWAILSVAAWATVMWTAARARRSGLFHQSVVAAMALALLIVVSPGSWVVHYVGAFLPMAALLRLAMIRSEYQRFFIGVLVVSQFTLTISGWFRPTVSMSLTGSWFLGTIAAVLACLLLASLRGLADNERPDPEVR